MGMTMKKIIAGLMLVFPLAVFAASPSFQQVTQIVGGIMVTGTVASAGGSVTATNASGTGTATVTNDSRTVSFPLGNVNQSTNLSGTGNGVVTNDSRTVTLPSGLVNQATNLAWDIKVKLLSSTNCVVNGAYYVFPNSVTACLGEIQTLLPTWTSNTGPHGIIVELNAATEYPFSKQIVLTNSCLIRGQGYTSSGFLYIGPTNVFTVSQMLNNMADCALIRLQTNGNHYPTQITPTWMNFQFERFYVKSATNFPCVLIGGQCFNRYVTECGFYGPDMLSTNGNIYNPEPAGILFQPAIVGMSGDVSTVDRVQGCTFAELADGYVASQDAGSYVFFEGGNQLLAIGNWATNSLGNTAYPGTSLLSLGAGVLVSTNTVYDGVFTKIMTYKNNTPIVFYQPNGVITLTDFADQSSLNPVAIGPPGVNMNIHLDIPVGSNPAMPALVTNVGGTFGIDNVLNDGIASGVNFAGDYFGSIMGSTAISFGESIWIGWIKIFGVSSNQMTVNVPLTDSTINATTLTAGVINSTNIISYDTNFLFSILGISATGSQITILNSGSANTNIVYLSSQPAGTSNVMFLNASLSNPTWTNGTCGILYNPHMGGGGSVIGYCLTNSATPTVGQRGAADNCFPSLTRTNSSPAAPAGYWENSSASVMAMSVTFGTNWGVGTFSLSTTFFTNTPTSGKPLTNFTGRTMFWTIPVFAAGAAGIADHPSFEAQIQFPGGSYFTVSQIGGGYPVAGVQTNFGNLSFPVPPNCGYIPGTNKSTGAGTLAGYDVVAGKTNVVTLTP